MKWAILCLAMLLFNSTTHAKENKLVARVIGGKYPYKFRVDMEEIPSKYTASFTDKNGKKWDGRSIWQNVITITCIEHCGKKPEKYHEITLYGPISVFQMFDDTDKFITVWGGATSYRVVVFQANEHGIRKFEEIVSKTAPQFAIDSNGDPVVIATNRFEKQEERPLRIIGIPYSFNGRIYEKGLNAASQDMVVSKGDMRYIKAE